jgi:hypothetical protein
MYINGFVSECRLFWRLVFHTLFLMKVEFIPHDLRQVTVKHTHTQRYTNTYEQNYIRYNTVTTGMFCLKIQQTLHFLVLGDS